MAEVKEKKVSPGAVIAVGLGLGTLAALAAAALVLRRPPTPPGEGIIWGFVTDALTGEAVPDVKITLNGLVRYTAWAGQYEIRNIATQKYRIQFSKEGYESVSRDVVAVVYEIEGVSGRLDISLPPIVPAKPYLVYARPAQAQVASG
ncbi:unnamed protein product, partial [marine sediment metagenome]